MGHGRSMEDTIRFATDHDVMHERMHVYSMYIRFK